MMRRRDMNSDVQEGRFEARKDPERMREFQESFERKMY